MLSIVIPTYNENGRIACLQRLFDFLDRKRLAAEVIIVDDSTDDTAAIATRLFGKRVSIIKNQKRLGKGGSIAKGIYQSKGEKILMMDADLSTSLKHIPEFEKLLDKHDVMVGSRYLNGFSFRSPIRLFLSNGFNSLVKVIFRSGIHDHQCGFKAFRRKAILPLLRKTKSSGFFWDAELLVRAQRAGLRIMEKKVEWQEVEGSKVNLLIVPEMLLGIASLLLSRN